MSDPFPSQDNATAQDDPQHRTATSANLPASSETEGYPKLANLMSVVSDIAIFRRFRYLNFLKLLRLQAELQDLEEQLKGVWKEDFSSGDRTRQGYMKNFRLMHDMAEIEEGDCEQYEIHLAIGEKLKEYNDALQQSLTLSKAPKPTRRNINYLRSWLDRPSMGDNFLTGYEDFIWDSANDEDFIGISSPVPEIDKFTLFLRGTILDIYHFLHGHRKADSRPELAGQDLRIYDEKYIDNIAGIMSSVLSSLLPTVMILALYFVKSMLLRIGLMIIFTTIFSVTLSIFTKGKKVEIFSATAAFAAVEVVFIGSTSTSGSSS